MSKTNGTTTKRVRCSNFSVFEENILVSLAIKRDSVLRCRKSDHDVWKAKNTAWKQIHEEFTAATGSNREIQNLKDKYENTKRKRKKLEDKRKKDMVQTGGGASASCTVALSATHNVLFGTLEASAVELHNHFDGDKPGKPLITPKEIDTKENIILVNNWDDEINLNDVNNMGYPDESETDKMGMSIVPLKTTLNVEDNNLPVIPAWAKWNPEILKTQTSVELTTPSTKKNITTMLEDNAKKYSLEKLKLIAQQKRYIENEERRAQERHYIEQVRAQEKHEWERVHYELTIEKLRHEINDLKKKKYSLYFNIN